MIVLSGDPSKATIAIPSPCAPLALSLESVIALCPGRHKIKRLTAKSKPLRDEDGNIVKEKMPCIDVTCQLRGDMMKEMLQETAKLKEEKIAITAKIELATEEREDTEQELESLKRLLIDGEAKNALLCAEADALSAESDKGLAAETEIKNRVTALEVERQRLAKIVFENKLRQQGVQVDRHGTDGLTLNPSSRFDMPPDFSGEPVDHDPGESPATKIETGEQKAAFSNLKLTIYRFLSSLTPATWCTMEPLNLSEHTKVNPAQQFSGVRPGRAMVRPKTTPANFRTKTRSRGQWEAQARLLPQPSVMRARNLEDSSTVRRLPRSMGAVVPRPRYLSPTFDARSLIQKQQAEMTLSRTLRDGATSVDSWKSDPSRAPRRPPDFFASSSRQRSPSRQLHPDFSSSIGELGFAPPRSPMRTNTSRSSRARGRH